MVGQSDSSIMMNVKLITLNIEGDSHLDLVTDFLRKEQADVVCLQEVFELDLLYLLQKTGLYQLAYVPLMSVNHTPNIAGLSTKGNWGVAMFGKNLAEKVKIYYYHGDKTKVPVFDDTPNPANRALIIASFVLNGLLINVATTHLTWVKSGTFSTVQFDHAKQIVEYLRPYGEFVLCGDFNAPRGESTFGYLAKELKDNVPANVTSTIDSKFHRVSGLQLVVDGIFSTPKIKMKNVKVVGGISDHKAVVGEVEVL